MAATLTDAENQYPGLVTAFSDAHITHDEDIQADLEGEQETLPDLAEDDFTSVPTNENSPDQPTIPPQWKKTVAGASKGVADKTESDYLRLAEQCVGFLVANKLIARRESFLSSRPSVNTPLLIVAWIMNECDTIGLDGKMAEGVRSTFTHAQKMRASMTYVFGRIYGAGRSAWQVAFLECGETTTSGNPSLSDKVSTYMLSLRRRKVQSGEAPTSARAITPDIMEQIYDYNHLPENFEKQEFQTGTRGKAPDLNHWGGPVLRRAAQAIYTIAFLCLLRIDEVLKIQIEHIEFIDRGTKDYRMVLTLPFRKTHQFGDIKPFVMHMMPEEEAYLCPVRAMADWIEASEITSGYVFRRMASRDRASKRNSPMTSQQALEIFRNNLIDIGIDPTPYGTHSFRRGGCQYLASYRRWGLRRICEWGGWSTEFSNATIVKYLISWNDDPTETREDFFNPNRVPATKCYHCGRSCHCG